jgi:hypothetical protein
MDFLPIKFLHVRKPLIGSVLRQQILHFLYNNYNNYIINNKSDKSKI